MSTELKTLTSELLHCLREDITAQRQTLEMIEAQRVAIQDESIDGVEVTTARMVEQMRGMQERDQERQQLLDSFSSEFDIPEPELTISNLAESLGDDGAELLTIRQELRDVSAEVIRTNRNLSALVGMRRRIVTDVIDSLLHPSGDGQSSDEGVLINAEA